MLTTTRLTGMLLIAVGVIGYLVTGGASLTALIPAFIGAVLLVLALVGRREGARRHAMHAAVALALLALIGTVPRLIPAITAGDLGRPAVIAQLVTALILLGYIALGLKSFVDARVARRG